MNTGGPAFPVPDKVNPQGLVEQGSCGMTLLDWMAGQALMGSLASQSKESHWAFAPVEYETADDRAAQGIAELCYGIASAMLSEKARREADHSEDTLGKVDHSPDAGKMAKLQSSLMDWQSRSKVAEIDLKRSEERVEELKALNRELVESLESLDVWGSELDGNLCPPDSNCSCHISPPCNDCVDFAGQREAKQRWEDAKNRARAAIAKAKGVA